MNKISAMILLLYCLAAAMPTALFARGSRARPPVVEVTGVVRLVGSAHFPELVISGPEGQWHVAKEDEQKLWDLQYQMVIVEGEETVENLTFANNVPAGERRTLRNITVISP